MMHSHRNTKHTPFIPALPTHPQQRQMNYFGFRKIAGKGKMAPCSYVNEAAKEDISSLLFIKRKKTGVSGTAARFIQQQNRMNRVMIDSVGAMGGSGLAGAAAMGMGMGMNMAGMGAMGMGGMSAAQLGQFGGLGMANPGALSLNNLQGMGGMMNGAGSNPYGSANPKMSNLHESALLREQQQMLAQLQHAHASASGMNGMGGMASGNIGMQQKLNGFGNGTAIHSGSGAVAGSVGGPLLTNDQGNLYTTNNASDWNSIAPAQGSNTTGLMQQNAGGFGGNYPQGGAAASDLNNSKRSNSAANLRALINQQISLFSNSPISGGAPGGGDHQGYPSNLNTGGAGGNSMAHSSGMAQVPSSSAAGLQGFNSQMAASNAAAAGMSPSSYELLQRNGMSGLSTMDNRQWDQLQLMQRNNGGAGNSFMNGYFGAGGAGGAQSYA